MHPQTTQDQAPPDAAERAARTYTATLAGRMFTDDEWAATRSQAEVEAMRAALAAAMPTTMIERGRISRNAFARQDWGAMRPIARPADDDLWRGRGFLIVSREVTDWREVTP